MNHFLTISLLWLIGFMSCNTTSKDSGQKRGADLLSRQCFELTRDDCYLAPHCNYDAYSYTCVNMNQGSYGQQSNCSFYNSEYECPRSICRWTGFNCVDLNPGFGNQINNSQCHFYNNDPTSCQSRGCLYINGSCQVNPNSMPGSLNNTNCFNMYQASTCNAAPSCMWVNNQCQNRF